MPQDVPVEASELLAFTPACLALLGDEAPVFTLRAATTRDKRYHRRLHVEEGVRIHGNDAIRSEVLRGLKELWEPEAFDKHSEVIKEYWSATDDFALAKKNEPDLEWSYDPEVERAINDLISRVADSWPPLRRMLADNYNYSEMSVPLMIAVVVKSWKGIETSRRMDRGYITLDCAEALQDDLAAFDEKVGVEAGTAWSELFVAAANRMYLDKEEEKNSASPSPSEMNPPASSETNISEADGKSPVSTARSTKTPKTS